MFATRNSNWNSYSELCLRGGTQENDNYITHWDNHGATCSWRPPALQLVISLGLAWPLWGDQYLQSIPVTQSLTTRSDNARVGSLCSRYITKLLSIYTPSRTAWGFVLIHILSNIWYHWTFNKNCSNLIGINLYSIVLKFAFFCY